VPELYMPAARLPALYRLLLRIVLLVSPGATSSTPALPAYHSHAAAAEFSADPESFAAAAAAAAEAFAAAPEAFAAAAPEEFPAPAPAFPAAVEPRPCTQSAAGPVAILPDSGQKKRQKRDYVINNKTEKNIL